MKNNKTFFLLELALGIIVIFLAVMMLTSQTSPSLDKLAVIVPDLDNNRWNALKYGLKMAAKDYQVDISMLNTGENLTAKELEHSIDQEINNGAEGIILQPVPGVDTEAMLKKIDTQIPVVLIESKAANRNKDSGLTSITPNNFEMGKSLAEEILKDYASDLSGKTIGILCENEETEAILSRRKGFEAALKNKNATISWCFTEASEMNKDEFSEKLAKVDIVAALDDSNSVLAGYNTKKHRLKNAVVYGIGHSTEAVYYLDTGSISSLIVPDVFDIGYQSIAKMSERLKPNFGIMKNTTVTYQILKREKLFSKENQELLFTMSQN